MWQALTVLEYLVANGSERVIDELQEHTYQIQVNIRRNLQPCVSSVHFIMNVFCPKFSLVAVLYVGSSLTISFLWFQTLCEFQYLEQSGKDQGINVRKKAQTLVALIKDKDKIREVRSKAAANRDKYRLERLFNLRVLNSIQFLDGEAFICFYELYSEATADNL